MNVLLAVSEANTRCIVTIASITIGITIIVTSGIVKWMQELATLVLKHEKTLRMVVMKVVKRNDILG